MVLHHARRTVHALGNHLRRALGHGINVAKAVDRGIEQARPYFEKARPLIDSLGLNSAAAARALGSYDQIRRILAAQ